MLYLFEFITENPRDPAQNLATHEGILNPGMYDDTSALIHAVECEKERLERDPEKRVCFIRYRHLPSGIAYSFTKWDGWTKYTPENLRSEF